MEAIETLKEFLIDLDNGLSEVENTKGINTYIQWLSSQIKNLIFELNGLLSDLEAGLSLAELGFSSKMDFEERIEDIRTQVTNLKALFITFKEIN